MKILAIIFLALISFNSIAEDRYKMVAGKDGGMWILDTKTSEVFHCYGGHPCYFLSNLENIKKVYPYKDKISENHNFKYSED